MLKCAIILQYLQPLLIKFIFPDILFQPGSDAVESAEKEIALWFPEGTNAWTSHSQGWIYE